MLYLQKIITQLAYPLDASLLLAIIAVLVLWAGRRRLGLGCLVLAIAWAWLWSTPVVSNALRLTLEHRYPDKPVAQYARADAIVVLGGALVPAVPPKFPYPDLLPEADREWQAARLYHAGKAPLVIASGGRLPWLGVNTPEAVAMRKFLVALGVPAGAIVLETHSRTTRQNAVDVKPILERLDVHKVLLVTSALHMPRALATFRGEGIDAVPAPTDFDVRPRPYNLLSFLPDSDALANSAQALHEYAGMFVYHLRGWTEADAALMRQAGSTGQSTAGR
ncbi:MAG TPA: YdcF family protein [Gammaproteobacteria bacterium]|nr:YdcF family protein [Gammaproteobacteria bacterium]